MTGGPFTTDQSFVSIQVSPGNTYNASVIATATDGSQKEFIWKEVVWTHFSEPDLLLFGITVSETELLWRNANDGINGNQKLKIRFEVSCN